MKQHICILAAAMLALGNLGSNAAEPSPELRAALATAKIPANATLTQSPDSKLVVATTVAADGLLNYALLADGKLLIAPSPMGLDFGQASDPLVTITKTSSREVNDVWKPLWGKRASVPDRYTETRFDLQGKGPFDALALVIRTYDDGIAFRYEVPDTAKGQPVKGVMERSACNFAGDYTAWSYNGENHNRGPDKLSAITGNRPPVMTIQASDTAYLALHEADLRQGQPLVLKKAGPTSFQVATSVGTVAPGFASAWRVVLFGRTPGVMVDSHLIELLNPPPTGDFSWVKPGVAVWDWRINGAQVEGFKYGMNYPSWIRMVDFAAENGIRHLVLDADWYGPEFGKDSDPVKGGKVNDVQKLIAYGKAKKIGIWLYLNDVGGKRFPIEQTLKQYGEWGAAGVKYGFMQGNPEQKNAWTRKITDLCAQNHLLCDYHDGPVHPYGQMRTYPNAVTREFCHAQLDARRVFVPKTFVTTVFVNMLSGPLDMNNGVFGVQTGRVDNPSAAPSTLVSEAARTLIVFSGATIIPDIPETYRKYPELLAFIAAEQQPWQESKTLSGVIGEHIVMARQAADGTWLVGAATDEAARELDIPLAFLDNGNYEATIVQDGDDAHYQTKRESLKTEKRQVKSTDTIHVKLAPGGGACVLLKKGTK